MAARFATIAPSGGDYTSLSAAEAGEQAIGADLVAAGDTLEMQYQGDWSAGADTTAATISGFTTGPSNWILVSVDSANRHDGMWDAALARMLVAGVCVQISDDYVSLVGLQLESTTSASARSANVGSLVDSCICRGGGVSTSNAAARVNVRNALLADGSSLAMARGINVVTSGSEIRGYNVTYVGTNSSSSNAAFFASAGTVLTTSNCLFKDTSAGTPTGWGGTGTIAGDYNASSDATAPGANSILSATFTFVNEGGGDYKLDNSDTSGAIGGGTDLSADPNLPVIYDASGTRVRPTAPTCGMWENNPVTGGAMVADLPMSLDMAGTLTGAGALSADLPGALALSGTLTGIGAMVADLPGALALSGTLTGEGSLSADLPMSLVLSGALTGSGALSGDLSGSLDLSGLLTGSGALVADLSGALELSGTLTNLAGAMTVDMAMGLEMTGTLTGTGAMVVDMQLALDMTGTLGTGAGPVATITGTWSAVQPGVRATFGDVEPGVRLTWESN